MILGAQRSGTTSLFDYLSRHPQVVPSFRKEVHFHDLHHRRGEGWYRANFPLRLRLAPDRITGEATPNYLVHPQAPPRVAGLIPAAKLIVVLREPVERAHSAWRLRRMEGREARSFEEAIRAEMAEPPPEIGEYHDDRRGVGDVIRFMYLAKSRYAEQIEHWLAHVPRHQLLVLQSESLFAQPHENLPRLWEFLDLEAAAAADAFPVVNQASPAPIDPDLRRHLTEYFEPHNRRLEALLGTAFDWG